MILEPLLPIEQAHGIIIEKLHSFFASTKKSNAVLGLSGGIDSAVVAALAAEALGAENVHGIIMPSAFSTEGSIKDSIDLANNLGISYEVLPIGPLYDVYMTSMHHYFNDGKWSTAQENIQARIRGTILMTYSNKYNALLLNTSNKSEISVGYGTLYGDLAGALMVIADLYKLQVYELAEYINRNGIKIPISTITKAPSAELRPDQKDTDSLPPYEKLDPILYAINEKDKSAQELIADGIEANLVDRIISLRNGASFKIMQIPPILTVFGKPLAPSFKCY